MNIKVLKVYINALNNNRKKQFLLLVMLMIFGAVAEMLSIGAIVPAVAFLLKGDLEINTTNSLLQVLNLNSVLILLALLFVLAGGVKLWLARELNKFAFGVGADLGVELFSKTIERDYEWHTQRNSSEVLGAQTKVQQVVVGLILPVVTTISSVIIAFGLIAVAIYYNPNVALTCFALIFTYYLVVTFLVKPSLLRRGKIIAEASNSRIKAFSEALGNIRDITLDGTAEIYTLRYQQLENKFRKAQATNMLVSTIPRILLESLVILIGLIYIFINLDRDAITEALPGIAAFILGIQKLLPLGQAIFAGITAVRANSHLAEDVSNLIDREEITQVDYKKIDLYKYISLENVKFKYRGSANYIFSDLNLKILKGEVIGLIGESGAGKSTLVDLITGLIKPISGNILIDDVALRENSLRLGWRRSVSYMPQTVFLNDAAIWENITLQLDMKNVNVDRLNMVIQQAGLENVLASLPDHMNTKVGERGARLSGGQRQRIGIARAMYRDADLLILDEATSALDPTTEEEVIDNIRRHRQNQTVIMIAHRLSTLKYCDRHWLVEKGAGVREVTREEFCRLLQANIQTEGAA